MTDTLRLAAIFTDHMVLQRDRTVPIWGEAPTGEQVLVQCGPATVETIAKNGRWMASLPPMSAGGPHELTIQSKEQSIVIHDVMFGEVWLAGGQSNMQWQLNESLDGDEAVAAANMPLIRYYNVPRIAHASEPDQASAWTVCSAETAGEYSAVAYYYARKLLQFLDIPIGIIGCNFGATSAACWMAEHYLTDHPELKIYRDEYEDRTKDFDWEQYKRDEKQFHQDFDEYNRKMEAGADRDELGELPWPPPLSPHSFMRPNGLYETMLQTVVPYGLRGFIYYQGESDADRAELYDKLLEALIMNWRNDWANAELPFLYVQLPIYAHHDHPGGEAWALLREAQQRVSERVPHTGMIVALDCGEPDDIHPREKQPIGERLAHLALNEVYDVPIDYLSPSVSRVEVNSREVSVYFNQTYGQLRCLGEEVLGFELSDAGQPFKPASARIEEDCVMVWSEEVAAPAAIRYGWANATPANLVNRIGMPAAPFGAKPVIYT